MKKVYLAGPDVFLPNAKEVFEGMKLICEQNGLIGLSPYDTEFNDKSKTFDITKREQSKLIYQSNIKLMNEADGCIANIEPFRGPSADPGTCFEVGYMTALNKPIVAYSHDLRAYKHKYSIFRKTFFEKNNIVDKFSCIEDFGLSDNLMITKSLRFNVCKTFEEAVKNLAIIFTGQDFMDENKELFDSLVKQGD